MNFDKKNKKNICFMFFRIFEFLESIFSSNLKQ